MILKADHSRKYLLDYKEGKIEHGLGIGCELDEYLRYKKSQMNIILGLDNVGKTIWMLWYFLQLSMRHNLTWCIWSGENKAPQLVRQLIQMYRGEWLRNIPEVEMYRYEAEINNWFKFIDNKGFYTNKDLYKMFEDSGCTGGLIDPFTGMNRGYTHADNYDFLNETREFVNKSGVTTYVNTHPHSEAARRTLTQGQFSGYTPAPAKSHSEGGQPFANRCDDFITIHRYVGHPDWGNRTLIYPRKIKDTETGGKVVPIDKPISFDFNDGKGFIYMPDENNLQLQNGKAADTPF